MFSFIRNLLSGRFSSSNSSQNASDDPVDPWPTQGPKVDRRIWRPSEESFQAERLKKSDPNHYVSDSFTDPSSRGGPLGSENEMPDGGDSTRGMSKGPASKSPMPTAKPKAG